MGQFDHEVRRRHQEGLVRQHRPLRRYHHVPWYCRPYAKGDHRLGTTDHEDQDHCSTREEILRMDWRIHPGFTLNLPTDVDQQAGVRRIRTIHRPQEVFLRREFPKQEPTTIGLYTKKGFPAYGTRFSRAYLFQFSFFQLDLRFFLTSEKRPNFLIPSLKLYKLIQKIKCTKLCFSGLLIYC